jgi:hypothetical protein
MKILIHTMYYLPEMGSAPILMDELGASLAARGHEVEIVTTIPRPPHNRGYEGRLFVRETRNGVRVKRFPTNFTAHHIGRLIAWTIYTLATFWNLRTVRRGDVVFLRLPPLQLGPAGCAAPGSSSTSRTSIPTSRSNRDFSAILWPSRPP